MRQLLALLLLLLLLLLSSNQLAYHGHLERRTQHRNLKLLFPYHALFSTQGGRAYGDGGKGRV